MRILLPLPPAPPPGGALRLAIDTAAPAKGEIRALCVVDREGIARAEAGAPPGAIHIALAAEEAIAQRLSSLGLSAVGEAGRACREAGVAFSGDVRAGDPRREIGNAAAACDLLVAGIGARFDYREHEHPAAIPLDLMKRKVIPVLLAASPYRPVRAVAVGCGGGDRTHRAVAAMARLGLWKAGCRIVLVAVGEAGAAAQEKIAGPRQILADEGYPPPSERIVLGSKIEGFLDALVREGAEAAVLGGYGEHRFDDLLGRSITGRLLGDGRVHLFLYT